MEIPQMKYTDKPSVVTDVSVINRVNIDSDHLMVMDSVN